MEVFGGSGTVLLSRPLKKGCIEIYNDFNSNLTNLFFCIKKRPLALIRELGFLPLNSRDGFQVLLKFFKKEEFTDEYLQENLELAEVYLDPLQYEEIRSLLLERASLGDVVRAANYYKLIRYNYNSNTTAFGGRPCDIRQFFHLIWDCSRRFARVVVENRDSSFLPIPYRRWAVMLYSMVYSVLFKDLLLMLDAVAVAFVIVVTGQTAVKRCPNLKPTWSRDFLELPVHFDLRFRQSPHRIKSAFRHYYYTKYAVYCQKIRVFDEDCLPWYSCR